MNPSLPPSTRPPAGSYTPTVCDPEREGDADSATDVLPTAVRSSQAGALLLPGRDISRWPCQLLELVLRHLDITDLAHASQTCRRWHEAASCHDLQARSFMRAYPTHFRQHLERTLDRTLAHQTLSLWWQQWPEDCMPTDACDDLTGPTLSPARLFYDLTRRMLCARRILACDTNLALRHAPASTSFYSPDGKYLVVQPPPCRSEPAPRLGIWRQGACGLHKAALCQLDNHPVHQGLTFSADSRSLLVVSRQGQQHTWQLQTWQLQADNSWRLAVSQRLCSGSVFMAKFSPDAHWLALKVGTRLLMFGETAPQVWQESCALQWTNRQTSYFPVYLSPDTAQFSADNRHFLFVNNGEAFVFDRQQAGWQAQKISRDTLFTFYREGRLSPRGDWLALAFWNPDRQPLPDGGHTIALWQRQNLEPHWRSFSQSPFASTGYTCPMAFSPDGRQLAAPNRLNNGNACVSVLSLTQDGSWVPSFTLPLEPGITPTPALSGVYSVIFNAMGNYLAAVAGVGVQLWRYQGGAWQPTVWIDNHGANVGEIPFFAFSPDGWHCAVSRGEEGRVSIHGPGPDGKYLTKMQVSQGSIVSQVLFSPDGLRLLVSSIYERHLSYHGRARLLHLAPAPAVTCQTARPSASSATAELPAPAPVESISTATSQSLPP
ncbi:MAG: F-box-like domain-containing protein [Kistimonas sp.]|nr:F-box-like domain-containing protein [Kistimonas sp.]